MVRILGNAAPKRKLGPVFFISKFTFLQGEQSVGRVKKKSQCRFFFKGLTLESHTKYFENRQFT